MAENKELTKEEIQKLQKELDVALKQSDELVKNFKVYIAAYRSSFKAQTSHITQEEYEMLQDNIKCYGVKSLNGFYEGLAEDDNFVTKKALMIDENNFTLAFHPMVWKVLTYAERIAAMRIAWQKTNGKEVKEFCNNITTTVAFIGENYKGSLNIGSILVYTDGEGPWKIFKNISDANNSIKFNYYYNKMMSKRPKYITDFESFEELQYIAPLEPIEENVENMNPHVKAVYYNQLEKRRYRQNHLNANYLLLDACEDLKGYFIAFDECLEQEIQELRNIDTLVLNELGYSQKAIDDDYLSIKVDIFNNEIIEEHNKLVEEYHKYDDKIKEIKKPALDATKDLRAERDKYKKELPDAGDALEIAFIQGQIDDCNIKINKIYKKMLKKDKKLLQELTEKREAVYSQIQELNSHIITVEDAKEHFKEYFYPTANVNKNTDTTKITVDTSKLKKEEYEKLN